MSDINPNENCHSYCRYAKYCRYHKGSNGADPEECAMYYKIEDLLWDATQEEADARAEREREFEETEDW